MCCASVKQRRARDSGLQDISHSPLSAYTVSSRWHLLAKMHICHPGRYTNFVEFELLPRKALFLFSLHSLICPTCLQRRSRLCAWDELAKTSDIYRTPTRRNKKLTGDEESSTLQHAWQDSLLACNMSTLTPSHDIPRISPLV